MLLEINVLFHFEVDYSKILFGGWVGGGGVGERELLDQKNAILLSDF